MPPDTADPEQPAFGARLEQARIRAGLSQDELAVRLEVSQPTISTWETGASMPRDDTRRALERVLDIGSEDEPGGDAQDQGDNTGTEASPFGEWLVRARNRLGVTRRELSTRSGLREPHIWKIEVGKIRNPRPETRKRLEQALGEAAPLETVQLTEEDAVIPNVGTLTDFDPHDDTSLPAEPGIYVFYDVSERPIYVGESGDISRRIREHFDKFWFKPPVVESAAYVRIQDRELRRQVEATMISFLKSNAVINRQNVRR
jgi:transcriptional regulator with XRE-family HTH domain